ncbi:MAG: choice-of-anchor B family protein [Bacteroidetes bacterium]|nr:choice-of-anchor B family protein [Bacteroidota bacterium]
MPGFSPYSRSVFGLTCSLMLLALGTQAQQNLNLVGHLPYSSNLSDVWGYVAPDGREYALIGAFDGVSVVDLLDPAAPVEVAFLPGFGSIWRDLKVWGTHAYATNETGGGLAILDLSNLPVSVDTSSYRERDLRTAHNLYIDSQGIAYLFGANIDNGGVTMLDLNPDPEQPVFLGAYTTRYVHDAFVRNDTLWTAEIQEGEFSIVDISVKSSPVILGTQKTPIGLTHNAWLSDNGAVLAISEEYPAGHIVTYDVTDPADIEELGRYRSNWSTNIIPHNVFFMGNWLVTSYYRDGVTLTDATRPENLVGTGVFDTSPFSSDGEFNGCWGVYPYLPSGLILATDIEEGLFVLRPTYVRGAYLEGTVRESGSGTPRLYARVEILGSDARPYITDFSGQYRTGTADSGLFTVRVAASGCGTAFIPDVLLQPGEVTVLDIDLACTGTALPPVVEFTPEIRVDPAVFSGSATLSWRLESLWQPGANVSVWNAGGQLVSTETLSGGDGQQLIGGDWPAGTYLLLLRSGGFVQSIKAIKL